MLEQDSVVGMTVVAGFEEEFNACNTTKQKNRSSLSQNHLLSRSSLNSGTPNIEYGSFDGNNKGTTIACTLGDRKQQEDTSDIVTLPENSLNPKQAAIVLKSAIAALHHKIKSKFICGTTLTTSLCLKNDDGGIYIVTANIGDSKTGLLIKNAQGKHQLILLSREHIFDDKECERIFKEQGALFVRFKKNSKTYEGKVEKYVVYKSKVADCKKRIKLVGSYKNRDILLAVPRALGDSAFPGVSADPAITAVSLSGELASQASILQACDGFWDILSPRQVEVLADFFYDDSNIAYSGLTNGFFSIDFSEGKSLSSDIFQVIQEAKTLSLGNFSIFLVYVAYKLSPHNEADNISCLVMPTEARKASYVADGHGGYEASNIVKQQFKACMEQAITEQQALLISPSPVQAISNMPPYRNSEAQSLTVEESTNATERLSLSQ